MTTLFDVWTAIHPYMDHILFGLIFGYIGYILSRRFKKADSFRMKYGIPLIVSAVALAVFKYVEGTLPVNTPTPIPGVSLNTVGGDVFLKALRQVLTIAAGVSVPLVYEKVMPFVRKPFEKFL